MPRSAESLPEIDARSASVERRRRWSRRPRRCPGAPRQPRRNSSTKLESRSKLSRSTMTASVLDERWIEPREHLARRRARSVPRRVVEQRIAQRSMRRERASPRRRAASRQRRPHRWRSGVKRERWRSPDDLLGKRSASSHSGCPPRRCTSRSQRADPATEFAADELAGNGHREIGHRCLQRSDRRHGARPRSTRVP